MGTANKTRAKGNGCLTLGLVSDVYAGGQRPLDGVAIDGGFDRGGLDGVQLVGFGPLFDIITDKIGCAETGVKV